MDAARVRPWNDLPLPGGRPELVLYWCMTTQRAEHNHALDAAIALGNHLGLPVVCYQALRPDYPYASDRIHAFVLDGLAELHDAFKARGVPHWLELPRSPKDHLPRIASLARRAAAVIADWVPTFVVPRHLRGAARKLRVPLVAVESACLVPMQRIPHAQVGAYALRPKLRKLWPEYRAPLPRREVSHRGRAPTPGFALEKSPQRARAQLERFEIDHSVAPVADRVGGRAAALGALRRFIHKGLVHYAEARNDAAEESQSGLSPYLHFGMLFPGEIADAAEKALGANHPSVEAFLEELLVRRELGFNYCLHTSEAKQLSLSSLPRWARDTLKAHHADPRQAVYSLKALEKAQTHDPVWNAAQRQLVRDGRIQGYLRMLWGKNVLAWSRTPARALKAVAYLNDRYALDGRDPASVGNFMWLLGLHDRPFPERPVFGKVRTMTSRRTEEKLDLTEYLRRYGA